MPNKFAAGNPFAAPAVAEPSAWQIAYPSYYGVKMVSASSGWIVGQVGTIKRFYNNSWGSYPSPVSTTLYTVDATASEGWAVGEGNTILRLSGSDWLRSTSPLSATSSLYDVDIVGPGEARAVGRVYTDSQHSRASLLHYTGNSWQEVATPITPTVTIYQMSWVSPTEGWLVGNAWSIFHYNNGTWTQAVLPAMNNDLTVDTIYMLNATEGWAGTGGFNSPSVLHYTAGTWQRIVAASQPMQPAGNCNPFTRSHAIFSAASNDYFHRSITGDSNCGSNIGGISLRHNNTQVGDGYEIYALSGSATNDVWAVGLNAEIAHWNGTATSTIMPSQPGGDRIQMVSASEGWLSHRFPSWPSPLTTLYHYTDSLWLPVALPTRAGGTYIPEVTAFDFLNPNDGWLLQGSPLESYTHYLSGTMIPNFVQPDYNLYDIQMITTDNAWAVGYSFGSAPTYRHSPVFSHFTAGSGQAYTLPEQGVLLKVSFSGPNDGWAIGVTALVSPTALPLIYHYDGTSWLAVTSPNSTIRLAAVHARAANDVWIGGYNPSSSGNLLHWDGSSWTQIRVPLLYPRYPDALRHRRLG